MDNGYVIKLYENSIGCEIRHVTDVDFLRYAQQAVKGHIEIVNPFCLPDPYRMIVNEEGLLLNMKINPLASYVYGVHVHHEFIVGPAIIVKQVWTEDGPDVNFLQTREEAERVMRSMLLKEFILNRAGSWTVLEDPTEKPFFQKQWKCSACGETNTYGPTRYCPLCGALMEDPVDGK